MQQGSFIHSMNRQGEPGGMFNWAYKGVDMSLAGNGGIECRDFLSLSQRCWESVIASGVAICALVFAVPRLRLPCNICPKDPSDPIGKRLLLLAMCLTFGIELGFKFATGQMIWIGNPCHLATMVQIFILVAPPSRLVTAAFRLQMHMLTGAPLALMFPVVNTRLLPFETAVYYIQHILMLVIPLYLMSTGAPFIAEQLEDFSWAMTSFGFLFIYHFLPLQLLAYLSQVNLNNMLCPAVSDPFHGQFYRLFAVGHQLILIPLMGKILVLIAKMSGTYAADICSSCCGTCPTCPCNICCQYGCENSCILNVSCIDQCGNNVANSQGFNQFGERETDVEDSGYGNGCISTESEDSNLDLNFTFDRNGNKGNSDTASQPSVIRDRGVPGIGSHQDNNEHNILSNGVLNHVQNGIFKVNGGHSCACSCNNRQQAVQRIVKGQLVANEAGRHHDIPNSSPRRRRQVQFEG